MIELLTDNHFDRILDLFDSARKEIRIISPFLAVSMAEKLCEAIEKSHVKCTFITRFYLEDMIAKASSLDALELLVKNGVEVYIVKKLHTKLYLFDQDNAIPGSANFTNGGFRSNIELSLLINGEEKITEELRAYFDDMEGRLKTAKDGILTADMLAKARKSYMDLFQSKKGKGKIRSTLIGGAAGRIHGQKFCFGRNDPAVRLDEEVSMVLCDNGLRGDRRPVKGRTSVGCGSTGFSGD